MPEYRDINTGERFYFEVPPGDGIIRPDLVLMTEEEVAAAEAEALAQQVAV